MNYWTSSCREPATLIFSPFQDHPHPPIGNILEKAFNNNLLKKKNNNETKLKLSLLLVPHFNQVGYELDMNH